MSCILFWLFVGFLSGCFCGYLFFHSLIIIFVLAAVLLCLAAYLSLRPVRGFEITIILLFFCLGALGAQIDKKARAAYLELAGQKAYFLFLPQQRRIFKSYVFYRINLLGFLRGKFVKTAKAKAYLKDYGRNNIMLGNVYLAKAKIIKKKSYNSPLPYYLLTISKNQKPLLFKSRFSLVRLAAKTSSFLASVIKKNLSPPAASFMKAVFLGEKGQNFKALKAIFVKAGLAHILAISGLHVGIILFVVLFFLKIMRLNYSLRLILALPLVLFYAFICSLRPPVLRAALFFFYFSLSFLLHRKLNMFCALAFAGLCDLILRPADVFSLSFQLSFLGVFFILVGFKYFYPSFLKNAKAGFLKNTGRLFLLSVFVNLGLWPLVSFYFGKIYLLNIFFNLLAIPFLTVILAAGFVYFLFAFSFLGEIFARGLDFLVLVFLKMNLFFAHLGGASFNFKISSFQLWAYYVILFLLVFWRSKYLIDLKQA